MPLSRILDGAVEPARATVTNQWQTRENALGDTPEPVTKKLCIPHYEFPFTTIPMIEHRVWDDIKLPISPGAGHAVHACP